MLVYGCVLTVLNVFLKFKPCKKVKKPVDLSIFVPQHICLPEFTFSTYHINFRILALICQLSFSVFPRNMKILQKQMVQGLYVHPVHTTESPEALNLAPFPSLICPTKERERERERERTRERELQAGMKVSVLLADTNRSEALAATETTSWEFSQAILLHDTAK
jgi:hypothetical protein